MDFSKEEREEALRRLTKYIEKHHFNPRIKDDFKQGQIDVSYKNADGTFSAIPLAAAHESYQAEVDSRYDVYHVLARDPFSPYDEEPDNLFLCFWSADLQSDRDEQDWVTNNFIEWVWPTARA